jgi:hypothetical protein
MGIKRKILKTKLLDQKGEMAAILDSNRNLILDLPSYGVAVLEISVEEK